MPAKEILSTALLLFSIVIGPLIFLLTLTAYGIKGALSIGAEYREQRYLRSLPCGNCRYFANDDFLPCAVNPLEALTEEAHRCNDFCSDFSQSELSNDHSSYLRTLFSARPKLKAPKRIAQKSP